MPADLDDILTDMGGISRYQVGAVIALILNIITSTLNLQSGSILSAVPKHRCKLPGEAENSTYESITIYYENDKISSCERPKNYNYSLCTSDNSSLPCIIAQENATSMIQCDNGWIYDKEYYDDTTVSKWNLVCDNRIWDSIINSAYFLGYFVGSGLFGILSDWYGRKLMLFIYCCLLVVTNMAASFSPWFAMYFSLRVFSGAMTATCVTSFTLVMEMIPRQFRTVAYMLILIYCDLIFISVPGIAYFTRNWKVFYFVVGAIGIPFLPAFYFVPESPRWLLCKGKEKQAKEIIEKCYISIGKSLDEKKWNDIAKSESIKVENMNQHIAVQSVSYLDLFRHTKICIITVIIIYCWIVSSMVFYGLVLNVTNLAGNPYLNAAINALMGLLCNALFYLSGRVGRRPMLSFCFIVAGIFCLLSMILGLKSEDNENYKTASVAMALIGKFFTASNYYILHLVTQEIFPTCVRAMGVSIGLMSTDIGGMVTPFTLQLQYTVPWLTLTLFGIMSILAGFITLLLPETKELSFITTLCEAEDFYSEHLIKFSLFFRKKNRKSKKNPQCYDNKAANV